MWGCDWKLTKGLGDVGIYPKNLMLYVKITCVLQSMLYLLITLFRIYPIFFKNVQDDNSLVAECVKCGVFFFSIYVGTNLIHGPFIQSMNISSPHSLYKYLCNGSLINDSNIQTNIRNDLEYSQVKGLFCREAKNHDIILME